MDWPTVTIVFLVHDRRDALRTSLRQMLTESDYDRELVDVVVVDNASEDGSAEMVAEEFPEVRLIRRETNSGVSGFNDGFAVATGDYVLALDDDCYLPPDGLRRAVAAARERGAQLVSFGVRSSEDPEFRFDLEYRTGLLTFWGCAVLIDRAVLDALGGYDPEIFVWANELELMIRFYDAGHRHLHLPEIVAVHMKPVLVPAAQYFRSWTYEMNSRHFAYIAGKLFKPLDAVLALLGLLAWIPKEAVLEAPVAVRALPHMLRGFAHGLRHRSPVRRTEVSRTYRRDLHTYAPPWQSSRPPWVLVRRLPGEIVRRALRGERPEPDPRSIGRYLAERERLYPNAAATLEF